MQNVRKNPIYQSNNDLVDPKYHEDSKINDRMLQGKKAKMTQILIIQTTLNYIKACFKQIFAS